MRHWIIAELRETGHLALKSKGYTTRRCLEAGMGICRLSEGSDTLEVLGGFFGLLVLV